jgi:nucleoid-associated protein YgaU
MRTDAKIGLVVGAVVVLIAGWYFLRSGEPSSPLVPELGPQGVSPPQAVPVPAERARRVEPAFEPPKPESKLHIPVAVSEAPRESPAPIPPPVLEPPLELVEAPVAKAPGKPVGTLELPGPTSRLPAEQPSTPLAPASPTVQPARVHVVEPGDSFARLAEQYYGSQARRYVDLLVAANPGVDPMRMLVGQKIVVPPAPAIAGPTAEVLPEAAPVLPGMYRVRSGDTFYVIAERLCGDSSRWRELYALNKESVGGTPSNLRAGQVLRVPADWPKTPR